MIPEDVKTELKPCPFCGGDAQHRKFIGNGFTLPRVEYTQIRCSQCPVETQPLQPHTDDRAVEAWNRRAILTDPSALLLEAEKALEPFAKAFEKARETYSKRYSDTALGAANFDKMPDSWAMDNLTFSMGNFRAALAVHGMITDEAQRGHVRDETISELVSLIERAQQNTPEHFSNWHDAARSTLSKIRGGE